MRAVRADNETDWREDVRRLCWWALKEVEREEDAEDLRRTLQHLETIDRATCQLVACEWMQELTEIQCTQ